MRNLLRAARHKSDFVPVSVVLLWRSLKGNPSIEFKAVLQKSQMLALGSTTLHVGDSAGRTATDDKDTTEAAANCRKRSDDGCERQDNAEYGDGS
jgi:hypothetical protein